jgi:hypothetical protein
MTSLIPYFATLITLLFGIAFAIAVKKGNDNMYKK